MNFCCLKKINSKIFHSGSCEHYVCCTGLFWQKWDILSRNALDYTGWATDSLCYGLNFQIIIEFCVTQTLHYFLHFGNSIMQNRWNSEMFVIVPKSLEIMIITVDLKCQKFSWSWPNLIYLLARQSNPNQIISPTWFSKNYPQVLFVYKSFQECHLQNYKLFLWIHIANNRWANTVTKSERWKIKDSNAENTSEGGKAYKNFEGM